MSAHYLIERAASKMILSDQKILEEINKSNIIISPFDKKCLGSNSYDVHLGKTLATYIEHTLDAKRDNPLKFFDIPDEGIVLKPRVLYLGTTLEYTESHKHVPFLEGKSSVGRLGISIHATAGKGDVGYCNHWTFEISCVESVRIYAHMPIAQLIYFNVDGKVQVPYNTKPSAKYADTNSKPEGSKMWKNFPEEERHNEHRHYKVYSGLILTSIPAQQSWICRDCGTTGTDHEPFEINYGSSAMYGQLVAKFSKDNK